MTNLDPERINDLLRSNRYLAVYLLQGIVHSSFKTCCPSMEKIKRRKDVSKEGREQKREEGRTEKKLKEKGKLSHKI